MGLFNLSNQQVARLVSRTVYKNLYQDVIHKDGFGITDRFVRPEERGAYSWQRQDDFFHDPGNVQKDGREF